VRKQTQLGDLFLRAQDYGRAMAAFRESLKLERNNPEASAGAGEAAFQTAQYPLAERYLSEAVAASPGDAASAALLKTTEAVLQLDPFRPQIADAERDRVVVHAFATAGDRLKACPSVNGNSGPPLGKSAAASNAQGLAQQWEKMKPQITERGLRRNPDLINAAMNLCFQIERKAAGACGPGNEADKALLLISNLHQES
jgi:tetratricopeptide (TPR) repeat protein